MSQTQGMALSVSMTGNGIFRFHFTIAFIVV